MMKKTTKMMRVIMKPMTIIKMTEKQIKLHRSPNVWKLNYRKLSPHQLSQRQFQQRQQQKNQCKLIAIVQPFACQLFEVKQCRMDSAVELIASDRKSILQVQKSRTA